MSLLPVSIADVSCPATVDETACGDANDTAVSALISVPASDNVQHDASDGMTNVIKKCAQTNYNIRLVNVRLNVITLPGVILDVETVCSTEDIDLCVPVDETEAADVAAKHCQQYNSS